MKKTAQTLLTAAMFATALGNSAANASTGVAYAAGSPGFLGNETPALTTTTMPLYGPPWVLSSLEDERQKTATTQTTTVDEAESTTTTAADLSEIPLTGTYSLQLSVRNIHTNEDVPGLECEFFNMQTGEVVKTWNTADAEKVTVTQLKYEFEQWNAFGSITYGIRIKNMPTNYTFAYSGSRDEAPVVGDSLSDFASGANLRTVVYLQDASKTATGTRPDDDPYRLTTTMSSDYDPTYTTPVVLYGPPWVFYPKGDVTMDNVTDARDLTLIKRAAIEGSAAVGYMKYSSADVNHDDVVDKEDIRIFREEVLGFPPKEEPVTTTTVTGGPDEDTDIVETTTETTAYPIVTDTWELLHPGEHPQTTMPPKN